MPPPPDRRMRHITRHLVAASCEPDAVCAHPRHPTTRLHRAGMDTIAELSPSTWFALYEAARRQGDRPAAAQALRRLRALGVRVVFDRPSLSLMPKVDRRGGTS